MPACRSCTPTLDALLGLVEEHDLQPADIETLTLRFPRSGVHCVDANPLKSHCAQYILPIALARREVRVADLYEDRREDDAAIADLAARTRVIADDELNALFPDFYASIIEIRTRGGRTLKRRNDIARGYPETPLSEEELTGKFLSLAGLVASPERVAALENKLAGLWQANSIDDLAALMAGKPERCYALIVMVPAAPSTSSGVPSAMVAIMSSSGSQTTGMWLRMAPCTTDGSGRVIATSATGWVPCLNSW